MKASRIVTALTVALSTAPALSYDPVYGYVQNSAESVRSIRLKPAAPFRSNPAG